MCVNSFSSSKLRQRFLVLHLHKADMVTAKLYKKM